MTFLQTPLRDIFTAFTRTLQTEPKIYATRNLLRILDEQKNWVDAKSQYEPTEILTQIPVYAGFLLIRDLFDIRVLDALGIKQLLLKTVIEPFSTLSANNITGSTDLIQQTCYININVSDGIDTYYRTSDLSTALQVAYTARLQIQLPTGQHLVDTQLAGDKVAYYDRKYDIIWLGIPVLYFALNYITLLNEPITKETLYTVYQVGNGRVQIQLYADFWLRYKHQLKVPINDIEQIAYCIIYMAGDPVYVLNPAYVLCNETEKSYHILSAQNYWYQQLDKHNRYFAIAVDSAQFAIEIELNRRLIIDITHHTLMHQYPECRLCIAYSTIGTVDETRNLNIHTRLKANKEPQLYVSYIDKQNRLHEDIPLLSFISELFKDNLALLAPFATDLLQERNHEFLLTSLLPNIYALL